jgi:uncharacterized membrane protein YcgQ (UPF0703/DUF1980 family)
MFLKVCASILSKERKIYSFLLLYKGIIIDMNGFILNSKSFSVEYFLIKEK